VTVPLHDEHPDRDAPCHRRERRGKRFRRVLRADRPERLRDTYQWNRRLGIELIAYFRVAFDAPGAAFPDFDVEDEVLTLVFTVLIAVSQ
jgi:hypothetical protein